MQMGCVRLAAGGKVLHRAGDDPAALATAARLPVRSHASDCIRPVSLTCASAGTQATHVTAYGSPSAVPSLWNVI